MSSPMEHLAVRTNQLWAIAVSALGKTQLSNRPALHDLMHTKVIENPAVSAG